MRLQRAYKIEEENERMIKNETGSRTKAELKGTDTALCQ